MALDAVVLKKDLPQHGLRCGDLGAIVYLQDPDAMKVEFFTASGKTQALVTLSSRDVRSVRDGDLVTVRSVA